MFVYWGNENEKINLEKVFTYAHTPAGPLPTPFMFYISATPKSNNFPLF